MTLEGAVAEVHLGKQLRRLVTQGSVTRFVEHDVDGQPDFTIWPSGVGSSQRVECKNVRDADEAYRSKGEITAYKVETQKTRTSQGDPSSRFYDVDYFDILAVCLGKKTGRWTDFMFVRTCDLRVHAKYPGKLAVMHRVPLSAARPWYSTLEEILSVAPA